MTTKSKRAPAGPLLRVHLATTLSYLAYRLLGATKRHAWDRARVEIANGIMDKAIETTGVLDPRHKGKPGVQAFFEGGAIAGETRFVEECGGVLIAPSGKDAGPRQHFYRRTDRKRGQQTVFTYQGLVVPSDRVSAISLAA